MVLGITGGISTGKTTAAEVVARSGVRVIDCDEVSRYLTVYNPTVLTAISEHFGEHVFHELGAVNRAALADVVFKSEDERRALERILHPQIKATVKGSVEAAEALDKPIVVVAPLLIEAGMAGDMDRLWVISCAPENQLKRLCSRSSVEPETARRWIAAQMPLAEKEKYADVVIRNDGTADEFRAEVAGHWEAFLAEQRS